MNTYQLILGVSVGGAAAAAFYSRCRDEEKLKFESLKPGRKTCLMEPLMLPMTLAFVFFMLLILVGAGALGDVTARLGLLFLHISAYYALLLFLLPLLRKVISARACATLWLVPTLMYFFIWLSGHEMRPLFVIPLPRRYLLIFMVVWACGFVSVLLWQILSHLRFRHYMLRDAADFGNVNALNLWHNESRRHGVKADIPVLVSEAVNTPLTIGCFDRTMRLMLPKHNYTDGELEMIFRHELRHILRCDTRTKLFLGFCTAMCWFNPFAWIARRKVADDLELSCDEAILSDSDENTRKQYAELLLKSAGSGKGYTTCLSAAAETLRYRLRNVLKPQKRLSGGIAVGIAMFLLIMTFGAVALADSSESVQTFIFDKSPADIVIDSVYVDNWTSEVYVSHSIYSYDEAALTEYISSLRVRQVYAGNYEEDASRQLYVDYGEVIDGETISLTRFELCNGFVFANIPYDDSGEITYIVDDEIDWEYIDSLLDFDAPDPDPAPQPPDMWVSIISETEDNAQGSLNAVKRVITFKDTEGTWVAEYGEDKTEFRLVEQGEQTETIRHLYDFSQGVGGCFGAEVSEARLEFSYDPTDYTVLVENWDRSESYTLNSSELEYNVLPLAPYSAHYTIRGGFDTVRDTHYEMEFYFDIGLPADAELWETD